MGFFYQYFKISQFKFKPVCLRAIVPVSILRLIEVETKLVSFENFKTKINLHEARYIAYNVGGLTF